MAVMSLSLSVNTDELKARLAVLDAALNKAQRKRMWGSEARRGKVLAALHDGLIKIEAHDADTPRG